MRSDAGLGLLPSTTLAECPPLDLLFIPGGSGQIAMMEDDALLAFLAGQGAQARWVTSVCTGALLLGAAGLLRGYRATTHWGFMSLLSMFGAEPVSSRVVILHRGKVVADDSIEHLRVLRSAATLEDVFSQLAVEQDTAAVSREIADLIRA